MEFDSQVRLTCLRETRDARAEAAQKAQRRRNDLLAALGRARTEAAVAADALARRDQPLGRLAFGGDLDDMRAKADAANARVADLEAAVEQATGAWEGARSAAASAGALLESCTEFARREGLPLPLALPGDHPSGSQSFLPVSGGQA